MSTDTAVSTKVVTGVVRLSYANVWEPKANEDGGNPKYGSAILIPKTDTVTIGKINRIIKSLSEEAKTNFKGKLPAKFSFPLHDGDDKDDENYANCFYLSANSYNKPGIVDKELNEILDKDEVYSGCYCKVSLNFFIFPTKNSKNKANHGIAVGLNNIMKVKDGDRLAGGSSAAADFSDIDSEDEDF